MRIAYRPLASFLCRHSFFESGIGHALSMIPTSACQLLMQRHRCLLRSEAGGGTLYAGLDTGEILATRLTPPTPLSFGLITDDPYFASYTATDWSPGFIFYFDNRTAGPHALPQATGEPISQSAKLPLKTSAFTHRFTTALQGTSVTILRASDATIVCSAPAPVGAFDSLSLDLRHLTEGRYELRIDAAVVLDFYLRDNDTRGLWGVVELFGLGNLATRGFPPAPPRYSIALRARETIWRYVITGAAVSNGATLAVSGRVAPKQPITFTGPLATQLGNQPALAFESAAPIALKELPNGQYAMSLSIRPEGASETIHALPCAGRDTPIEYATSAASGVSQIIMNV